METEEEIFTRYEAELASIAVLDRRYYLTRSPTLAERRDYATRQLRLDETRSRFYAELTTCRLEHSHYIRQFRRCRSIISRSHVPTPSTRD